MLPASMHTPHRATAPAVRAPAALAEANPEEFFVPLVWSLAVAQGGIPFTLGAITLFTPTGAGRAAGRRATATSGGWLAGRGATSGGPFCAPLAWPEGEQVA